MPKPRAEDVPLWHCNQRMQLRSNPVDDVELWRCAACGVETLRSWVAPTTLQLLASVAFTEYYDRLRGLRDR